MNAKPHIKTSMIFGGSGAGKTHLCCTYPKPAWIGSTREEGFVTIQTMDRANLYDPKVPVQIFGVSSMLEMMRDFNQFIIPQIRAGKIETVCVELSYYTNDVIDAAPEEANGWVKYMALMKHINFIDKVIKAFPNCRLVYNALSAPEKEVDKAPTGILTAGKAISKTIPAATSLFGYLRTEDKGNSVVDRVLHLTTYGPYMCRHRFGNKLPPLVRNPSYRKLEQLLSGEMTVDHEGYVVAPGSVVAMPPAKTIVAAAPAKLPDINLLDPEPLPPLELD
jgi:hypothetical protein